MTEGIFFIAPSRLKKIWLEVSPTFIV